jgi:hypothetical protein
MISAIGEPRLEMTSPRDQTLIMILIFPLSLLILSFLTINELLIFNNQCKQLNCSLLIGGAADLNQPHQSIAGLLLCLGASFLQLFSSSNEN